MSEALPLVPLPAWSEPFAADRRAGLRRLPPFAAIDRDWAFGAGDGSGVVVAIVDSGVEGGHPAVGGRLRQSVRVELDGRRGQGRGRRARSTRSATGRPAPGSSTASRRQRRCSRSGSSAPTTGARASRSRPACEWAIEQRRLDREPQPVVAERVAVRAAPRARRPGLLRQRPARLRRQQRRRRELPVPVRRRSSRSRRTTSAIPTSGSTTRGRRSSSARTASTSTSPGRTAAGSARRATASRLRTSPGSPRGSGRPTRARPRSR